MNLWNLTYFVLYKHPDILSSAVYEKDCFTLFNVNQRIIGIREWWQNGRNIVGLVGTYNIVYGWEFFPLWEIRKCDTTHW